MAIKGLTVTAVALAATLGINAGIADSASASPTLEGQTITIIINSNPGGGTDASARQVGSTLVKYLPGQPRVIFRNLPGGGGVRANNYFYEQVEPDGMTLLSGSRTQISPVRMMQEAARYNPGEYRFVGGTNRLGTVIMINRNEQHRLLDRSTRPLAFGGIDGERSGSHAAVWAAEYLGWNIRFILGYPGTSEMLLAARRGEIDMVHNQVVFNVEPLLNDNMVAVVQLGNPGPGGRMVPRGSFPDIPLFETQLLPKLDAQARRAYDIWASDNLVDKWLALPPKTPEDLVEMYREAYDKAMQDPQFLEIVRRELGADFEGISGQEMDNIVAVLVQTTEEDLAFFNRLRVKHGNPPS